MNGSSHNPKNQKRSFGERHIVVQFQRFFFGYSQVIVRTANVNGRLRRRVYKTIIPPQIVCFESLERAPS